MSKQVLSGRGRALRDMLKRLREAGYGTAILGAVVPDWWTKDIDEEPDASTHLKILLGRRLGLDIEAILQRNEIVPQVVVGGMQFKRSANLTSEMPSEEALAFCATLARAAAATIDLSKDIPSTADQLRAEILCGDEPFVSLDALLRYCWSKNIAVLHVTKLPGKRKGMDALVYRADGRNIIVLTRAAKKYPPAWLSFLIAHELGHIALGHVADNAIFADECKPSDSDNDEIAANSFAQTVLAGSNVDPFWMDYVQSPDYLYQIALQDGKQRQIDPGHILLRWGKDTDNFPLALKAWNLKTPPMSPKHDLVNEMASVRLNTERLSESMSELVTNVLSLATT